MTSTAIRTTAFLAAACTGLSLHAAACPTQKAAITQPDNRPSARFAIAGLIDIDHDGKSDIHLVRRMIALCGGTIDAEIDIDGKATGRLRRDTAYIILGKLPDKTDVSSLVAQQFDIFMHRATEWSIRVITVDDLLGTGTRRTAPNRDNRSIFRQRRSPRRRAGSAY